MCLPFIVGVQNESPVAMVAGMKSKWSEVVIEREEEMKSRGNELMYPRNAR
jgi:hypothetical protein